MEQTVTCNRISQAQDRVGTRDSYDSSTSLICYTYLLRHLRPPSCVRTLLLASATEGFWGSLRRWFTLPISHRATNRLLYGRLSIQSAKGECEDRRRTTLIEIHKMDPSVQFSYLNRAIRHPYI